MFRCSNCGEFCMELQYYSGEKGKDDYYGCPHCESTEIYEANEDDGYFCGYCPECENYIADIWEVVKGKEFDCECKDCKKRYHIKKCEIDYEEEIKE